MKPVSSVLALALLSSTPAAAEDKSPRLALGLSLGGTIASMAPIMAADGDLRDDPLAIAGFASLLITPSLGQLYSGRLMTTGFKIRAVSGVATALAYHSYQECGLLGDCRPANIFLLLSGLGLAVGTLYDVYTVTDVTEAQNARHGVSMSPTVFSTPASNTAYGLAVGGSI